MPSSWVITFTRKIGPLPSEMSYRVSWNQQILDKYAVAVKGKDGDVITHLPLGKSGKFAKTVFYFLKSGKNRHSKIAATGKATNAGDGLGV